MNQNLKSHLALLGANFIYGLNYVIAKGIMPDYLMPKAIIFLRVIVTVLVFGILHFIIPSEKVEKRDLFKMAICALFGVAINQILFFEGLNLSTPINASIIITAVPVLILIFSHYILKEKITTIKVLGILLGAGYMLWTFQRVFLGGLKEKWSGLKDLNFREYAMLVPLTVIVIFLGVYPSAMLDLMNSSVNAMVKLMSDAKVFYGSIGGM